jgi:hypothetical protein
MALGLFDDHFECQLCRRDFCIEHILSINSNLERMDRPVPMVPMRACEECSSGLVRKMLKKCAARNYYTFYEECTGDDDRPVIYLVFADELQNAVNQRDADIMELFPMGVRAGELIGRLEEAIQSGIRELGVKGELIPAEKMLQLRAQLG